MDFSSLLPMLMQRNGSGGKPDMTAMINAMMPAANAGAPANPASGGMDTAALLSMLQNRAGGGKQNLDMVNMLSALQKNRSQSKKPYGLKPVKLFIPDEILGKLVKFFQ